MSGWNLKCGSITEHNVNEDRSWSLFNFAFSNSSKKRNTYKFGLIKALLDNIFNGVHTDGGVFYSYEELFSRFAENYWNLVVKYDLRQMRKDGKSVYSKVETIFMSAVEANPVLAVMEFGSIDEISQQKIIKKVTQACKKYVVGAVYREILRKEFEGDICFYCRRKLQKKIHVDCRRVSGYHRSCVCNM